MISAIFLVYGAIFLVYGAVFLAGESGFRLVFSASLYLFSLLSFFAKRL